MIGEGYILDAEAEKVKKIQYIKMEIAQIFVIGSGKLANAILCPRRGQWLPVPVSRQGGSPAGHGQRKRQHQPSVRGL